MARRAFFKMDKKVFLCLAYIATTPQKKLTHTPLQFVCNNGSYIISHGKIQFGNYSIRDLRAISRLLEELTDKVVLVDINSLIWNRQIEAPAQFVMSNYWEDECDGSPLESHQTFLHDFKKIKVNSKMWIPTTEKFNVGQVE